MVMMRKRCNCSIGYGNILPAFISRSGEYGKPVSSRIPVPQYGCSPGSVRLNTAVIRAATNPSKAPRSNNMSLGRCIATILSFIQEECSIGMAGFSSAR